MAIIWYERTKEYWIAQNLHIQPKDYRKVRGFGKVLNIKQYLHHLPEERRRPNGEIIESKTTWTEEEIFVWLEYQKLLEDNLAQDMMESYHRGGFYTDLESLSDIHKCIEKEVAEHQEHYTL